MESQADLSLKQQKEAFVTGHGGTTPWEVFLVCLAAPISLACYRSIDAVMGPFDKIPAFFYEALLVWFPMVLCQTEYLYPYGIGCLTLEAGIALLLAKKKQVPTSDTPIKGVTNELAYLTAYRSSILYLTFIAILAVDFQVFPRRFCKTEVSGFGLMDVGAASFCISAGFVSPIARRKSKTDTNYAKTFRHIMPLVVIGVLRIITNQELEYQEHVTEYGVHWNFFFTMGVLALIPPLFSLKKPSWIFPAVVMICYQCFLTLGDLQGYIEEAPRMWAFDDEASTVLRCTCNFFAANREGILGCLGYLSLYYFGEWVGYEYIWKPEQRGNLLTLSIQLWLIVGVLHLGMHIPMSRRSTNACFCVWASAHNVSLLNLLQWIFSTQRSNTRSCLPYVWQTVNRHGLFMFLIANLLTGLVNLTLPTLTMSSPLALVAVFSYIVIVGVAAIMLDSLFRLWKMKKD